MIYIRKNGAKVFVKKQTHKSPSSKTLRSVFSQSNKRASSNALNIAKTIEHYAYAEAIVASLSDPMVILDSTLKIKSANAAFFKLFKLPKKSTYGKNIFDFSVKKNEIPNLKKLLKDVLTNNIPQELEITHTFKKTGEKTLLLSTRRIVLDDYKTKLILLSIEDISERKERELSKDDFIGYVTHELKTPLTSISMLVQILADYHKHTKDTKSQYLLAKTTAQIDRLTNLLNSFGSVYRAQNGMLELYKEKVDLNKLISEAIGTFQYIQSTHEIVHEGKIKKQISIDKERINEVIINLLTNAIKYSPDADKVVVTLSEDEKKVTLSIQDFGLGIRQDEKDKVFERFFRVKAKQENHIKGLGLGLYLVMQIIKSHKGKLWVESVEREGSTFFFSLPKK